MKGKNKSFIILFGLLLVTAFGLTCFAKVKQSEVAFAKAEQIDGYSERLEGDVIFSAENVYVADAENRGTSVKYEDYQFPSIMNNENNNVYFGNYGLKGGTSNKKVVRKGQYVMVNDKEEPKPTNVGGIEVSQAIMITVGGYYYGENDEVKTTGEDNTGSANLEILSITAKRNGTEIAVPGNRSNNAMFDFVWFLDATAENEGHYELAISYMVKNGNLLRYDFDFYLLLKSSYENEKQVNEINYAVAPTFENVTSKVTSTTQDRQYKFFLGEEASKYPTLTFDYTRYNLTYTFNSGDTQRQIQFEYKQTEKLLVLSTSVYNSVKQVSYPIDVDNTIVTLMFTEAGRYTFDFDFVYYNEGQCLEIPTTDLDFADVSLDIYGYELMYSKSGYKSAQMQYLEIAKNGTMFILVNGFQSAASYASGSELGVNYALSTSIEKTGKILGLKSPNVQNSNPAINVEWNSANEKFVAATQGWDEAAFSGVTYQITNQGGLWLTLNDNYDINNSYYFFNSSGAITMEYANAKQKDAEGNDTDNYANVNPLTKVTTFTQMGYYLIQARYSYKDESGNTAYKTQYFAFRVTSSTPQLDLYVTDENDSSQINRADDKELYAREFTNKNVYGWWKETDVFESKINGKLYYSTGKYPTEAAYRNHISGTAKNDEISWVEYSKNTVITNTGSYMLTLELENTSTRTYTFFTIDKERISGLKVYEVATVMLDNLATYSILRDANQNFVDYTSRGVVDVDFTLNWNDKASRAKITGGYTFTPFVKMSTTTTPIKEVAGADTYLYVINNYTVGTTSKLIEFSKPKDLNSTLTLDNILATQGIYVFNLVDQAGNELQYIMVLDRTEALISAVYGEDEKAYVGGSIVTEDVSVTWGTHKAISLGDTTNEVVDSILRGEISNLSNYYAESGNNLRNILSLFRTVDGKKLFVVENNRANIHLLPEDKNSNYYVLTSQGQKQTVAPNGYSTAGWDELGNKLLEQKDFGATGYNITIKKDAEKLRYYKLSVISANQTSSTERSTISVSITPDEARGTVYASPQENGEYTNWIMSAGEVTKYDDNGIKIDNYGDGQASNDGRFVFEWQDPTTSADGPKVTKVRYDYYELMDQTTLNSITDKAYYYPYKWASSEYILNTESGSEVNNYKTTTRGSNSVYQSNPINLGYETYYDDGVVVSRNVTRTGLYIVTRTIGSGAEANEFSYAFFVDRNQIVGYSTSSVSEKIVGQFIHNTLPTSEGELHFDNFAIQGLSTATINYIDSQSKQAVQHQYKVYLETNKLPTRLRVPSGKYVSGNISNKDAESIIATSYNNLELSLSVYFVDTYKLLLNSSKGATLRLMNVATSNQDGYINLSFDSDNKGLLADYKKARIHTEDDALSVPGVYVFVLNDSVGKVNQDTFEQESHNVFTFGVKLTRQAPSTDVYAYTQIDNKQSDKTYSDERVLYTNEGYVDFELPVEDISSYQAQLDPYSFEVYQTISGNTRLWLRVYRSGNSYAVDTSGIIQNADRIVPVKDADDKVIKYIIRLDTKLGVSATGDFANGEYNASDMPELNYSIKIQYVLVNSNEKYYTYLDNGQQTTFYSTTYNVYVDRTPSTNNLSNILSGQQAYFTNYEQALATQDGSTVDKLNTNYQYRDESGVKDYYVASNKAFYTFVGSNKYDLASQSMYAVSIAQDATFDISGLSKLYYRQLDFDSTTQAETRMGLMPICDTYFGNSSGFYTFAENLGQYTLYSFANFDANLRPENDPNKIYYRAIFGSNAYDINSGTFYEIVEKDLAGNYTQYVIYFQPTQTAEVGLVISGTKVNNVEDSVTLTFDLTPKRATFIGISDISVKNIASAIDGSTSVKGVVRKNQHYGKISIYSSAELPQSEIFINSTITDTELNRQIKEILKDNKNYTIKYTDIFNKEYVVYVDNYQNAGYSLNTSLLTIKTGDLGQKYIELSPINTKIADDLYCYVTSIIVQYGSNPKQTISFAATFANGQTVLALNGAGDSLGNVILIAPDRLNLGENIDYTITLTDTFEKVYSLQLSTSDNYYSYKIVKVPTNSYSVNDVMYTASEVQISYNSNHYTASVRVWVNGQLQNAENVCFKDEYQRENYRLISLYPDNDATPTHKGSLRRFEVELKLQGTASTAKTYEIWIDTRTTEFNIENANKEPKLSNVKSYLNNENSGAEYNRMDLIQDTYYTDLINESVTLSWTRLTSDYFTYKYELLEFTSATNYKNLLTDNSTTSYQIPLKDKDTTGKYVFKVSIYAGSTWIADRIFTINMSTTITGLYEVKHNGEKYEDFTITTFREMEGVLDTLSQTQKARMASDLKFKNVDAMENAFSSFGYDTAIPMYISTLELKLNSNKDNGVNEGGYSMPAGNSHITLYHVYKSNYRTFVIIMKVEQSENLLSNFTFSVNDNTDDDKQLLSGNIFETIIPNENAVFYKLKFNSYSRNTSANILEQHNKLEISVYYNGVLTSTVTGGNTPLTEIEFRNSGNYTLIIKDKAGNKQMFGGTNATEKFTIVLMKELLYSVYVEDGSGEMRFTAPIQYAYYDKPVTIKINNDHIVTGAKNYIDNSISLTAYLNNSTEEYRGYTKPANSYTYTFEKYGTYLIKMSARLSNSGEQITSQLVFTILNPNEARTALDFTSIYSYDIKSVHDVSKSVEKDVTEKFLSLLADKPNQEGGDVYNKLVTYERVLQIFGSAQGKMKFRVVYEANDDTLLPSRQVEFSFTLNNETPTISCSIGAGKKTTKPVTIKYNASILYSQLGECYIVVNGDMTNAIKIDENSANEVTQLQIENVGKYYVQVVGDSGSIASSFNFTIKEPLNTMSIVLIVVISAIVIGIVATFIWLRTRMKVR